MSAGLPTDSRRRPFAGPEWLGCPEIRRLDNGMTVALLADDAADVVSTALWYRAGTAHEPVDREGVAHFLEHMMFKGSERFPAGEVDRLTQAAGGSNNAYTSHDSTVYVFSLPRGRWRTALEIEADRMRGLILDPAEVAAERAVILEEVAELEDDPWGRLDTAVLEALYGEHPYGRRILGRRESLTGIGAEELAAFHRTACAPGRAVLTVAGAVGGEVLDAAAELFGGLADGFETPAPPGPPASPRESRRVEVSQGRTPRAIWAWPAPPARERDFVGLRLALTAICGGRSSRLQRVLVDEGELCSSVTSGLSECVLPGAASLAVELLPGVDPSRVELAVASELERVRREGIGRAELERARRLLTSDWYFGHETVEQRGLTLGAGLALFGEDFAANRQRWLVDATVEEVGEIAARFLDPERDGVLGWAGR